jgi:hypothetical protein
MCCCCDVTIDGVWTHLAVGQAYATPDGIAPVPFSISHLDLSGIRISPQGVTITREAFSDALHYLRTNRHDQHNPCVIRANNDPALAGPLCNAARMRNANVRCISYVLPVLAALGIVATRSARPNTAWVTRCS